MNDAIRTRMAAVLAAIRTAGRVAAPFVDLVVRLSLGGVLFAAGVMGMMAPQEGMLGALVALAAPPLLASGLLARVAAAAMLVPALAGVTADHLAFAEPFRVALLGWYVVHGAGALSLDALLEKGLSSSALPFATRTVGAARWVTRVGGPVYRLGLRARLATLLVGGAAPMLPQSVAILAAVLLAAGLATPVVAAALLATAAGVAMAGDAGPTGFYGALLLALLGTYGAGRFSLDGLLQELAARPVPRDDDAPRVIIVGAGFGGMACAAGLRHARARVTLVDRHNYHLFQPLLYQVATAGLSPGDIASPIRTVFRNDPRMLVLCGAVSAVDADARTVTVDGRALPYDHLVLATGASHGYFGRDEWAALAPGLKSVDDAVAIRGRILSAFERAEAEIDPVERARLLTFLICGGGPTGVELAGAIAELARQGMDKEFRRFDPAAARVILVQSAPRLLPQFPENLSAFARRSLEGLGVDVRTGARVEAIDADGVTVGGARIPAATVLWAAGVVASPAAAWLGVRPDAAGRIPVAPDLSVPDRPEIFAIGDTATVAAWDGQPVPGLAPAAKQGGTYVAKVLRARIGGRPPPPPFRYRHQGSLATIGRKSAVADFGWIKLSGAPAWWLWGAVHLLFLVGVRNRFAVTLGWVWSYFTFRLGVRLITGGDQRITENAMVPSKGA